MNTHESIAATFQRYAAGCYINASADVDSVGAVGITEFQRKHRAMHAASSQELASLWYKYARVMMGVE